METEVAIDPKLVSKNDGRKKAWWTKKIEALEKELAEGNGHSVNYNEVYAQAFFDAMCRFQIRNKAGRNQIKLQILTNGPGAVKRIKGLIF